GRHVWSASAGLLALAPLGSIGEEHFDRLFAINVKGLLFTVQKALPLFTTGGAIILNASVASVKGGEACSVYSGSKAAVRSFARCWTTEARAPKIRGDATRAGPTATPGLHTP